MPLYILLEFYEKKKNSKNAMDSDILISQILRGHHVYERHMLHDMATSCHKVKTIRFEFNR